MVRQKFSSSSMASGKLYDPSCCPRRLGSSGSITSAKSHCSTPMRPHMHALTNCLCALNEPPAATAQHPPRGFTPLFHPPFCDGRGFPGGIAVPPETKHSVRDRENYLQKYCKLCWKYNCTPTDPQPPQHPTVGMVSGIAGRATTQRTKMSVTMSCSTTQ